MKLNLYYLLYIKNTVFKLHLFLLKFQTFLKTIMTAICDIMLKVPSNIDKQWFNDVKVNKKGYREYINSLIKINYV